MKLKSLITCLVVLNSQFAAAEPAATQNSSTTHVGAFITSGSADVRIGGLAAARQGDSAFCPLFTPGIPPIPHVGGSIIQGSATVRINGLPAARTGDTVQETGATSVILNGNATVLIGG